MRPHSLPFIALSLGILTSAVGCTGQTGEPSLDSSSAALGESLDWPTPKNWSAETFPFPLFFAPELAHRGVEELRFTPGYGDPNDATYFSYSFAWMLDDAPSLTPETLGGELTLYFSGLAHRFDPTHFDPYAHAARIDVEPDGRFLGTVNTVDPFNESHPIALRIHAEATTCGEHALVVFSLSPRPAGDPTWALLDEQRSTLRCAAPATR
jgi:hypothetical protein